MNTDRLISILKDNQIAVSGSQADALVRFYELLTEKNKVMNLTAITDFDEYAVKHIADSLAVGRFYGFDSQKVIDVGTGAGFPGIPLKIMYPDIELTLLDSLNKRLVFLDEVIAELGLKGIHTLHARAEEAGRAGEYREQYDVVVSRAVASLSTLVEYCIPFASVNGTFISYKGSKAQEELDASTKAISVLGGKLASHHEFVLSGTDYERSIILIKKISSTPNKYPRSGGKPVNNPIM